ncbi:MAG: ATP-binding protein [Burkholderiales bacterium]
MTTLRLRLVGSIGASLTILWSVLAVWMFMDVRQQVHGTLDDRLAASARMVAGLVARLPPGRLQAHEPQDLPLDVIARDALACEVSLVRGEVSNQPIARTATSPGLEDIAPGFGTRSFGGKLWRTYVLIDGDIRIATADRMDARVGLLDEIALSAAFPFGVAMLGSLVLLWICIGRGLAPFERVRAALLHRRVDADAPLPAFDPPPELQPLIDTIGHLLRRVQQAIERERRFTDDAAHELRTPLTVVKTHLQVLRLACADTGLNNTAGEALANAEHGVTRLHRTLDQLLMLARLEGSAQSGPPAETDALHAAQLAIDDSVTGSPADSRVALQSSLASVRIAVSEPLLVSALRNLLDNALRHSPCPGSVVLRVEAASGEVKFSVLDAGPGLPPAERMHALKRFWRRAGGKGSGLGLSIVDAIAKQHGGSLHLLPRDGGGLEARLCLPKV